MGRYVMREEEETVGTRRDTQVVVVGAGVAGCTCAAVLAGAGVEVTLVNPALDHVCRPAFGPELRGAGPEAQRLMTALSGLPKTLGQAWMSALVCSADGRLNLVDRRLLSVRVKQALEGLEGLRLRQGLVVGVRVEPEERRAVRVETAFGETLVADAVVIAVGLGMRSAGSGGSNANGGGGAGGADSGGLEGCLRAAGAELREGSAEVWPSYRIERCPADGALELELVRGVDRGGRSGSLLGEAVGSARVKSLSLDGATETWGPPSPYVEDDLWPTRAWVEEAAGDTYAAIGLPDGVATGEWVVAPRYSGRLCGEGEEDPHHTASVMTRPGHLVRGLTVANVDESGRLVGRDGPVAVWVTGRAAGAQEYVESVEAAIVSGRAVALALSAEDANRRADG